MAAECGPVRLPPPVMLARPTQVLPDRPGLAYEPKLDGVRAVYGAGRLWSRHARELHIGEAVAAAGTLGAGVVLDGELVVLTERGCDFPAVCRRLHAPGPPVVTYVVFDLLAAEGNDMRARPYGQRRQQLSGLFADADPRRHAGVQLMPATTDVAEAARWYASPLAEGSNPGHQTRRRLLPAAARPAWLGEAAFCSGVWVWQDWDRGAHLVVRRLLVRDTCRASPSRLERSWAGRATSMHSGWRGRFFGVATTAGATG